MGIQIEIDARGRPRDQAVTDTLLELLSDGFAYAREDLRRRVSARIGRSVSWNTINAHLNRLAESGRISKQNLPLAKKSLVLYAKSGAPQVRAS